MQLFRRSPNLFGPFPAVHTSRVIFCVRWNSLDHCGPPTRIFTSSTSGYGWYISQKYPPKRPLPLSGFHALSSQFSSASTVSLSGSATRARPIVDNKILRESKFNLMKDARVLVVMTLVDVKSKTNFGRVGLQSTTILFNILVPIN